LEEKCSLATLGFLVPIEKPCNDLLVLERILLIRVGVASKFNYLLYLLMNLFNCLDELLLVRINDMVSFLEGHGLFVQIDCKSNSNGKEKHFLNDYKE
jgi:hypothetical protein